MRGIALFTKLIAALSCALALAARADDIEVRSAELVAAEDGLRLTAEFAFELSARLDEVVANGIPLYFNVEFELTRPRWYWFDEKTAAKSLQVRLSYHALSRQYRLSTGALHRSFATQEEALEVLRHVRSLAVAERAAISADTEYQAAVRMRLDTSLLPKPFQLSALTSRDLHLESPWQRFTFRLAALPPAPDESRDVPKGAGAR